jgi:hypothetical protein
MSKEIIKPSIKRTENETSVYVSLNKLKKKASLSSLTESISKLISHQVPTRPDCLKKKKKIRNVNKRFVTCKNKKNKKIRKLTHQIPTRLKAEMRQTLKKKKKN